MTAPPDLFKAGPEGQILAPIVQSFQDTKIEMSKRFGLAMRLGFGLALLAISWGARAVGGDTDARFWSQARLPQETRERFISDQRCHSNPVYFRSCLRALHAAEDLVQPRQQGRIKTIAARFSFVERINELTRSSRLPETMIWGRAIAAHLQEYDRYANMIPVAEEESLHAQSPQVNGFILSDHQTGYLMIRSFDGLGLCHKVESEIVELTRAGAKRWLVDIRQNRGGYLRNALCVAGLFMGFRPVAGVRSVALTAPSTLEFFSAVSNRDLRWLWGTQPQITELPLYVWIDHDSASSAEIFAGSLRQQVSAILLGEPSRGKARVQSVQALQGTGLALSVTVEDLVLPDGNSYQDIGLKPDVLIPSDEVPEFVTKVLLN